MKVSAMNSDQYKISIEAHPLQMLYSKYNDTEDETQYQSVRPLGKIRQKGRPSSDYHTPRTAKGTWNREKTLNGKRDMKLDSRLYSGRMKCNSDQNISSSGNREKDANTLPILRRSKTQAFEEKFKIAASRQSAETPSPQLRSNKNYDRKVVHLPLFKINLRTYVGEEDVSRTVAKTRESLRKLMDLNKLKMRNANVITANIKNYEFNAPRSNSTLAREHTSESARTLVSLPFHAKPALRSSRDSSRDRDVKGRRYARSNTFMRFGASEISSNDEVRYKNKSGKETPDRVNTSKRHISDFIGPDDEPDSSMVSLALRPDTSLTLGTTMYQIDRVIKTPTSDELREIAEAFKNSDTSSGWPNTEDIQSLVARNQSRTTKSRTPFSRPTTVLNNVPEVKDETVECKQKYSSAVPYEYGHKHSPVLRYTSKQSTYKLEPIVVPSHTCTDCPMCNGSQRDVETPCPPNTPNTGQFMYETSIPHANRYMNDPSTSQVRRNMYEYGVPQVSRYLYDPDIPQRSRTMFEADTSQRSRNNHEAEAYQRSRIINESDTSQKNQFMYGVENRTVILQGSRVNNVHSKPEMLRVSRINMNGYTSPEDDSTKISFMKTF